MRTSCTGVAVAAATALGCGGKAAPVRDESGSESVCRAAAENYARLYPGSDPDEEEQRCDDKWSEDVATCIAASDSQEGIEACWDASVASAHAPQGQIGEVAEPTDLCSGLVALVENRERTITLPGAETTCADEGGGRTVCRWLTTDDQFHAAATKIELVDMVQGCLDSSWSRDDTDDAVIWAGAATISVEHALLWGDDGTAIEIRVVVTD